ncbi:hypothetical protein QBC41DRAFT_281609 [Cercophora samala]|uniref:F-box domain-containing protein n=1 Tax=Cercophora samala TaxID=330535 RepID=A0AA39Z8H3_9PEZI|nr:hypothetical protein QBC41DRAFT_281609 [Cercophora samala]
MASSPGKPEGPPQPDLEKPSLCFMTLPSEVQKEIVRHCSQADLICFSLVSKHCRELAAAQLYRNFHIVFPDEDDPEYDSPIDGLAGGLDTFVTSDYNYAQHLRDLSLDTLSAGHKAETAYKAYLANLSCGKFMNTLLLMTLRRARALERFRWNIRVELSRTLYKELHNIKTLAHLHIRLQEGPSIYETPPPLPYNAATSTSASLGVTSVQPPPPMSSLPPPPPPFSTMPPPPSGFYVPVTAVTVSVPPPPPPAMPKSHRPKAARKTPLSKEPPTLSGFKELKSLAVLDIDSLDMVTEIKSCVRNSSATLSKLKLSFSDKLALQARKPAPEADPDDSDVDDDFQPTPAGSGSSMANDMSGPARAFRAMEEKKAQESVLGRILDVEVYLVKKAPKKPKDKGKDKEKEKEKDAKAESNADNGTQEFVQALKTVMTRIVKELNDNTDPSEVNATQKNILETFEAAATKYIQDTKNKMAEKSNKPSTDESSSSSPGSSKTAGPKVEEPVKAEASGASPVAQGSADLPASLFGDGTADNLKDKQKEKDVSPEDIDIEAPEEILQLDGPDALAKETPLKESGITPSASTTSLVTPSTGGSVVSADVNKAMANLAAQKANFKTLAEKVDIFESQAKDLTKDIERMRCSETPVDGSRVAEAEKQMYNISQSIADIHKELTTVEAEINDAEKQIPPPSSSAPAVDSIALKNQQMNDYLRTTRGLALQTLAIYLIPVKASVLYRAIDLRVLRRLTLLNVGPQAPIWAQMAKLNKEAPLPLRKIFTDNVTPAFLTFVHELEEVEELFMLERDFKYKPESFAPRTPTTIEQIRRLVLKKHMPTLKYLMIKNLADPSWDLNEKTVLLLCRKGRMLEELAACMSIRTMHTFMQRLAGLVSLRALHIAQLRNEDTCVWVMRETKKFLIDNLSHHPHLKLEWISIDDDDRVERLIRARDLPRRKKEKGEKKKNQSATTGLGSTSSGLILPSIETDGSGSSAWMDAIGGNGSSDDSEDSGEEEDDERFRASKIETVGEMRFYDVYGVRIFEKEVVSGRL